MKKYLLLATICVAAFCSCEKGEPVPTKDIEVVFNQRDFSPIKLDAILEILNSKKAAEIRTVYLVADGNWSAQGSAELNWLRCTYLEPAINLSPKVKGKGDFNYAVGQASKVPEDSLWIVQHGWTINKRFIENPEM
ncbi:MAG: hypothetical protein J1D86_05480 [Alistipes sp.]|nr:hypothetical protein [Alistipes sp.]